MKDREAMQQAPEFTRGAKQKILGVYANLHQHKLGAHWLWCAIERIANGEPESQVLAEFGYAAQDRSPPVAPARMLTDAEIYSCVGARSHDAQQLDDLLALFCKVNGLTLGAPPAGNTGEGEAR